MSLLESKISDTLTEYESIMSPIRSSINRGMMIYGDTDFTKYILIKATFFALDHAVHLAEEDRLALYKLLKLNTSFNIESVVVLPPVIVIPPPIDTPAEDLPDESPM